MLTNNNKTSGDQNARAQGPRFFYWHLASATFIVFCTLCVFQHLATSCFRVGASVSFIGIWPLLVSLPFAPLGFVQHLATSCFCSAFALYYIKGQPRQTNHRLSSLPLSQIPRLVELIRNIWWDYFSTINLKPWSLNPQIPKPTNDKSVIFKKIDDLLINKLNHNHKSFFKSK